MLIRLKVKLVDFRLGQVENVLIWICLSFGKQYQLYIIQESQSIQSFGQTIAWNLSRLYVFYILFNGKSFDCLHYFWVVSKRNQKTWFPWHLNWNSFAYIDHLNEISLIWNLVYSKLAERSLKSFASSSFLTLYVITGSTMKGFPHSSQT